MLRALILRQPWLVALLVALALAMRALVPAGMMVESAARVFAITICADSLGQTLSRTLVLPARPSDPAKTGAAKACAFSVLTYGAQGADAFVLAALLLFILAAAFAPLASVAPRRVAYAHPPARAPPSPRPTRRF
jgi:hypothetical protein